MPKIKITNGTFGLSSKERLIAKTSVDEPFEVDKATAERLVSLGVAEIVEKSKNSENTETNGLLPDYHDKMTNAELQDLAINLGAEKQEVEKLKKSELIELLDDLTQGLDTDGEKLEVSAMEPV